MRSVVVFSSLEAPHMSGRVPYELHDDGEPLFSAGWLHDVFRAQKIPPLSAESLGILAEKLNNIAAVYHFGKETPDYQAESERLATSLDCVAKWLSDRGMFESGKAADAFKALAEAIDTTDIDPLGLMRNLAPRAVNWKGKHYSEMGLDLASACANAFSLTRLLAGKPTLGLSNQGPVARYVLAIVPRITGDQTLTLAAIAKHLKEARRNHGAEIR